MHRAGTWVVCVRGHSVCDTVGTILHSHMSWGARICTSLTCAASYSAAIYRETHHPLALTLWALFQSVVCQIFIIIYICL